MQKFQKENEKKQLICWIDCKKKEVVAQDEHNIYVRSGNSYGEIPWVQQLSKEEYRFFNESGKEIFFD